MWQLLTERMNVIFTNVYTVYEHYDYLWIWYRDVTKMISKGVWNVVTVVIVTLRDVEMTVSIDCIVYQTILHGCWLTHCHRIDIMWRSRIVFITRNILIKKVYGSQTPRTVTVDVYVTVYGTSHCVTCVFISVQTPSIMYLQDY